MLSCWYGSSLRHCGQSHSYNRILTSMRCRVVCWMCTVSSVCSCVYWLAPCRLMLRAWTSDVETSIVVPTCLTQCDPVISCIRTSLHTLFYVVSPSVCQSLWMKRIRKFTNVLRICMLFWRTRPLVTVKSNGMHYLQFFSLSIYKVVQIWPGLIVCKQVTVCPGHIWTTLYFAFTIANKLKFQSFSTMETSHCCKQSKFCSWRGQRSVKIHCAQIQNRYISLYFLYRRHR
jgi:hypothetical protein